jgi:hypothetical protein
LTKKSKALPSVPPTVGQLIYAAFCEGYNSYATPAVAFNTVQQAWEESEAKQIAAQFMADKGEGK